MVATVANVCSVWNRAVVQLIRKAMRLDVATCNTEMPIPMLIVASVPVPTFVRAALDNLLPITTFSGAQWANFVVMTADKADGLAFDMT